jgi:hypothetical protein
MAEPPCVLCEGGGLAELQARTFGHIAKFGRTIIGVTGPRPFAYTIGHTERNLPEMLVIGMHSPPFLNRLGDMQNSLNAPLLGDVDLGGLFPVRLQAVRDQVAAQNEYTCQVQEHYGPRDYDVTQVLIPDLKGRFPGEPGCDPRYDTEVL